MATGNNTDWNINTDIYDIAENINNLEKRYIEDQDETTLSLGIFGFTSDVESKKIQIATIMAGELGNEMFPSRAKLTKNVLSHAVYHNIEGINAKPSRITLTICIKMEDIEKYVENNKFYLEADMPINIEEYEFHLDYDVMITRKKTSNGYSYSAQYIVADENDNKIINRLSDITHPYLKQPFIITIGNYQYLGIQCTVRQCTIEKVEDTMISDSVIENRSYEFQFDNQMADFTVTITEGDKEYNLIPYLYGSTVDETEYYCWYLYVADDTIRITFDSRSFLPSLNSSITIKSWTTLGTAGNFDYLGVDGLSPGLYCDITSEKYNYKLITAYVEALTNSIDGADRKSKEELQKLIPKAALSRGSVTTETDLNNYFDLINDDVNRLVMQKKVDNQLARVWYGYFLLKDTNNNIIPTNTINLKMIINSPNVIKSSDGRYILPAGSVLRYDPEVDIGEVIDDSTVPPLSSEEYFNTGYYYYMTIYNIVLCRDPLYCAFYLTNRSYNSYFLYDYVNEESDIQFIANHFHFERKLLVDQDIYKINFTIAQSIIDESLTMFGGETITYIDDYGNTEDVNNAVNNIKVVMVFYRDGNPYRWTEAELNSVDETNAYFTFSKDIMTDSQFDDKNRIKLLGLNEVGANGSVYGFFDENSRMDIYILAKLPNTASIAHPRKDLDNIAPGYTDYTVTNIYTSAEGLNWFDNYTDILNTKVLVDDGTDTVYYVKGVPVVGRHYMRDENYVNYFMDAVSERKAYIDYCLKIIENSINIDYKFFNTYGPSKIYKLADLTTAIGNINLTLNFKISLKDSSDTTTKSQIISTIKSMMENINDIGDWHASVLIQDIMNQFDDRINFIEFVGFNNFDADDQHIVQVDIEDPTTIPEFLNIRNTMNTETYELEPCINIETVE